MKHICSIWKIFLLQVRSVNEPASDKEKKQETRREWRVRMLQHETAPVSSKHKEEEKDQK